MAEYILEKPILRLKNLIEALLFSSPHPVSCSEMVKLTEADKRTVIQTLQELQDEYEKREGALAIREINGKWQMIVKPEYGQELKEKMKVSSTKTISRKALETLAIISLYQPLTKTQIDLKRGVDSAQTIRTLLERGLIAIAGRSDLPGKPFLYKTTDKFLEVFGIRSEEELERLKNLFWEKKNGETK
ncbi:MAG TPA: SMC-Scp complex subunit ScpB [Candidatus Atribacteria bacterium]|jgi:segregation and condensation protein B|nr:SMC-Scp complex subunit ScpB [Atribacterota bacterium]MDI9607929.1 SMC-Scp complex subunit ScpB [Atribacterota bacterium]MDY0134287.1 SMC-Scp complex subunit ScpB [Atribacterota bacterium]HOQ50303.1 SMC-Scp complex subunit ScpB [Candidatus Atribacteria bacterium]HPT62770.1 SMC-Scp complex subunit ScpB [Candidatus Atribacteria bacterium]